MSGKTIDIQAVPTIILSVLFTLLLHPWVNAQMTFVPDPTDMIISEFKLKNGDVIRGKVKRMVNNEYYEVRLPNKTTVTLYESQIETKKKVLPDIRENSAAIYFGPALFSKPIPQVRSTLAGGFFGLSYDFGRSLAYSVTGDLGLGAPITTNNTLFEGQSILTSTFALGYRHNRLEKVGQSYFVGFSGDFSDYALTLSAVGRFELPITVGNFTQIVPFYSLHVPLASVDENRHPIFSFFGVQLKFYLPSAKF